MKFMYIFFILNNRNLKKECIYLLLLKPTILNKFKIKAFFQNMSGDKKKKNLKKRYENLDF